MGLYIRFPGQVLLPSPSRCSACTSVSEGVFLMDLWREVYSTSTYSSAILFSLSVQLLCRVLNNTVTYLSGEHSTAFVI